ncbi:hypothetical protein RchiOBHm_Chr2g0110441 [Rosa chinensis]|uniref:Uncharacterized protein n=1 Tax=Rosa chinensis TaxID=74649 RepID=A0A2P6RPP0_ROSCH|nr:hypothetical protein RchiOBHm_Chr2g0110441 [Rosa chinensis]
MDINPIPIATWGETNRADHQNGGSPLGCSFSLPSQSAYQDPHHLIKIHFPH